MSKASTLNFWTKVHRWLGLGSMLFLLLAAISGCVLCIDKTLDAVLNADLFRAAGTATPLDPIAAVARFSAEHPGVKVTSFPLHVPVGRTHLAATVAPAAGFDQVFIDPADAHMVGSRRIGPGWDRRHLVEGIYEFHYTLLAGIWGRWLMGIMALGWLIGNGVGFYLDIAAEGAFLDEVEARLGDRPKGSAALADA